MEAEVILIFGVIVLACGSAAMLTVRLCSPSLQGTEWLSGAFAAGSLGAGLVLVQQFPLLSVFGADFALLGSFILLHIAVLRVARSSDVRLWPAGGLFAVQAVVDALRLFGLVNPGLRLSSISLLIALQSFITARVLWHLARQKVRAPAMFSAVLLISFGIFNLLRSLLEGSGMRSSEWHFRMSLIAFAMFIAVALGLAFGFFWMTTAMLTEEVEHMASTDPLTRLYNRRVFLRWCEKEVLRSQRSGVPFSVLMVDLDHFKRINDTFGHQRGDEVLCAAVERMQDSVRGIDVLCRWGGEEFAVLLPNAPAEATQIVAERIRENVEKMTMPASRLFDGTGSEHLSLTVSIGAATYRDLEDDIAAMLVRADRALYRAKGAGRNMVLVAS